MAITYVHLRSIGDITGPELPAGLRQAETHWLQVR